jgi:hypothetical protein
MIMILTRWHVDDPAGRWLERFPNTKVLRYAPIAKVGQIKDLIQQRFEPQGINVGVNCGEAAGQTVFHAHIHVIPRYVGDVARTNPQSQYGESAWPYYPAKFASYRRRGNRRAIFLLRCMSPLVAPNRAHAMSAMSPLWEPKRK